VVCRSHAKEWNLHTIADIKVECLDVWDYERILPPLPNATRPEDQFSNTYKALENIKLYHSYQYDETYGGYQGLDKELERPEIRQPEIEMGVMRWARRKTNAQRRNLYAHIGQSVHSLDPDFMPPNLGPQNLNIPADGSGEDPDFPPVIFADPNDAEEEEEEEKPDDDDYMEVEA